MTNLKQLAERLRAFGSNDDDDTEAMDALMNEAAAVLDKLAEQKPVGRIAGGTARGGLLVDLIVAPGGRSPQFGDLVYAAPVAQPDEVPCAICGRLVDPRNEPVVAQPVVPEQVQQEYFRRGFEAAQKMVQPVVPEAPDPALIDSMALRYRHDFGLLDERAKEATRITMRQLWEEVVGKGFYRPAPPVVQEGLPLDLSHEPSDLAEAKEMLLRAGQYIAQQQSLTFRSLDGLHDAMLAVAPQPPKGQSDDN